MTADPQGIAREQLYWRNAAATVREESRYLDASRWEGLAQWQRNRNRR